MDGSPTSSSSSAMSGSPSSSSSSAMGACSAVVFAGHLVALLLSRLERRSPPAVPWLRCD
jgi:hypothetical protein